MSEPTENNPPSPEAAIADTESKTDNASTPESENRKATFGLIALVVYVALLGLGTIGELFDVEWILDLPIFRPPGKY